MAAKAQHIGGNPKMKQSGESPSGGSSSKMSGLAKTDEKRTPSAKGPKGAGRGKNSSEGGGRASGVPQKSKKQGLGKQEIS